MFWIWFDWQVWMPPFLLEKDGENLRLNETTRIFCKVQPEDARVTAMLLEILEEERWEKKQGIRRVNQHEC